MEKGHKGRNKYEDVEKKKRCKGLIVNLLELNLMKGILI